MAEYGVLLDREELDFLNRLLKFEELRFDIAAKIRRKVKQAKEIADEDAKTLRKRP